MAARMTSHATLVGPRNANARVSNTLSPATESARRLVEITTSSRAGTYRMTEGVVRIGRDADNDIVVDDPYVSRHHAEIRARDGRVTFVDLATSNGSYQAGRLVRELELKDDAVLLLGRHVSLRVGIEDERSPRPRGASELVGSSAAMDRLRTLIHRAAATNLTVLIEGEPGSGKDGVVRALHAGSTRNRGPLVVFDCTSVAPDRVAAELFGYVRGALSGLANSSEGAFRRATHGTLYLDGICELPLDVQGALLRALDTREIRPVGGDAYVPVNVRVVASTHRSLEHEVAVGHFRKDLMFRLAVARIRVPSLRQRTEDVGTLAEYFARCLDATIAPCVLETLAQRTYRENVRELRSIVETAALRAGAGRVITHLTECDNDRSDDDATTSRVTREEVQALLAQAPTVVPPTMDAMDFHAAKQLAVDAFEREYLAKLLNDCAFNLSEASRRAGVDRGHLRELCRKHDMDPARLRGERASRPS